MLKIVLLAINLSLFGCGSVPEYPEVWQCAFDGEPRAFFCVNTKTNERMKLEASDPAMKGAQCMSLEDYQKSEDWVRTIKELAERRCQ